MNVLTRWFWGWPQARQARVRKHLPRLLLAIVGLWIGYGLIAGEAGLLRILALKRQARALEAEVARLEAQTRQRREERDRLRSDPAYLEKIAREDFGLARPDELVFRFAERAEGDSAAPAPPWSEPATPPVR